MVLFKKESSTAIIPERQTEGAAGFDLYADEKGLVTFGAVTLISTGVSMDIPEGFVGLIKPRSGWAVKHGIDTMAGVIDSDYRGTVNVLLTCHRVHENKWIEKGDRIAQIVFIPIQTQAIEVSSLTETERGTNGFGSTGEK